MDFDSFFLIGVMDVRVVNGFDKVELFGDFCDSLDTLGRLLLVPVL